MPLIETKGAASSQGFGQFAKTGAANWIEDCFSCFLYTGNGSTQTITNGIDLSTNGGLVWLKARSAAYKNLLQDTARGPTQTLSSNTTDAQAADGYITSFNTSGFSLAQWTAGNGSGDTFASWTFRKQPKFFDVVTYTGNGAGYRDIGHSLASTPGMIVVKRTDAPSALGWVVWHRSTTFNNLLLNSTAGAASLANGRVVAATETTFGVEIGSTNVADVNANGGTYVAYLFAHNAGGFGLTGTDNVISCGSYTLDGSNPTTVNLGYEPQFLIWKASSTTGNWFTADNMRGLTTSNCSLLFPNLSNGESTGSTLQSINATGFTAGSTTAGTYIYIAIRRGPMKTPTSGTSVFGLSANSSAIDASTPVALTPSASDFWLNSNRANAAPYWFPRLAGWSVLRSSNTAAESGSVTWSQQTQSNLLPSTTWWSAGTSQVNYFFLRAPGFFDTVCYTGDGTGNRTLTSNLGVLPELCIVKARSTTSDWFVGLLSGLTQTYYSTLRLNTTAALGSASATFIFGAQASSFGVPSAANSSGVTYIAYLFASCPGVSKVGSYTGTGAAQTINCGFTGGARFVLIKRTDSTGDWYVYDSARGITSGNDPYFFLNSTAAEVTNTNYVDTTSVGFQVTAAAPAGLNANGGTYIFLAIA